MMAMSLSSRWGRRGTQQIIGRIALTLAAEKELKKYPDGEIRAADGTRPKSTGCVRALPQHVELSNVNITDELINSIEDQRQYEINIKLISSAPRSTRPVPA